jgi:outer membrane translocation and assembly module TamA
MLQNSSDALKQRLEEMRLEGVQKQEATTLKQREKERKANERLVEEEDDTEEYYDIQVSNGESWMENLLFVLAV